MNSDYVAEYESLEKGHWWWQARRDIVLDILEGLRRERPGGGAPKLLDIGCGAGVNLASFRETFDCVGVEPDAVLVEKARANSRVPVHHGTLPAGLPPLGPASFDYVLLLDVIEHIEDDRAALESAAALLKPGGRMIINVPALPWMWSVHDEVNQHKRRYLAAGLREVIGGAGLAASLVKYWGAFPVPLAFLERQAKRLLGRAESYHVPIPSPRINGLCRRMLTAEFSMTKSFGLPLGLSLIAVAHKP